MEKQTAHGEWVCVCISPLAKSECASCSVQCSMCACVHVCAIICKWDFHRCDDGGDSRQSARAIRLRQRVIGF